MLKLKVLLLMLPILLFSLDGKSLAISYIFEKKYNLTVKSSYRKNRKVWGAFKLFKKQYKLRLGNKVVKSNAIPVIESIVFKKNNLFLVKSILNNEGRSTLKVKNFPFQARKNSFTINLLDHQNPMNELFSGQIESLLENKKYLKKFPKDLSYSDRQIHFKKMDCKKRKTLMDCTYHIEINIPLHKKTIQM